MKEYYQMSRTEAQKSVNGSTHPLSEDQIKKNQQKYGPNALVEEKKKSILQIFLEQYKDFLVIILIVAAIVSGLLGETESAIVILVVITMYAILGTSGSGKTTFLSLLAGLDQPKEGQITYQGESLKQIGLQNYRKNRVSIVFQAYNLLPYLSAVENVLTAMAISQTQKDNPKEYAYQQLEKVGLTRELADKRVSHLSGGQQQRVAIVRAVCCGHDLIVADEPTGNLDEQTSQEIIALFQQLAHEQEKCIILVTHEKEVANASDEVYVLKNQQLTKQADSL